ncbi:MAG: hypothetical protein V3W06_07020 [Acidimicrobiia bacterium]
MTVNLEAQLRDYSGYVGSLSAPVELEEILSEPTGSEPMRPIRLGEPRRRPPRWLYGVAAAVATVLLIGAFGVAILLLGNESEVIDTPPTVVTTLPGTTPTTVGAPTTTAPLGPTAPTVAFAAEGWQLHDVSPDAFGNEQFLFITEIVEWNGRLHAVGSASADLAPSERPVIWASDDGVEWTRTFVGSGEDNIMAVIPGGPGLVAVGLHRGVAPTRVWVSEDGVTWVESRLDIPNMKDITVVDDRLFAVASYVSWETADELQLPPLYSSDDGATWTGIPRTNFEPPQNGKLSELFAVVSGPAGLVAYGDNAVDDTGPSETDTNYRPDAGFWSSADGTTWTWANVPTHLTGGLINNTGGNALAGGPRGYVAYRQLSERIVDGNIVDASDIVLFSEDGSQWEIGLELHEDSGMRINPVAATAEGFIATGVDINRQRGVIWTSPDGVTWTLVSEDQSMFDNVAIDGVWPTATGLIALSHIGVQCAEIPILPDCSPVILTWSPGGQ